jgi:hypothetical protein
MFVENLRFFYLSNLHGLKLTKFISCSELERYISRSWTSYEIHFLIVGRFSLTEDAFTVI